MDTTTSGGVRRGVRPQSAERAVRFAPEELRQLAFDLAINLRQVRGSKSFVRFAASWLRRIRPIRAEPENERRHVKHLRAVWRLVEGSLTKARVEEALRALLKPHGPLAPSSVNKVRSTGKLILDDAAGNGEWFGRNPFDLAGRVSENHVLHDLPTRPELGRALQWLRSDHRHIALVLLYLGLRPGEALSLRREDLDLVAMTVHVRRSNSRDQTKTGRERRLPIPAALMPYLLAQLNAHRFDVVFASRRTGGLRQPNRLTRILRVALRKAEVSRPRMRFYDLRHCFATWAREDGVDPAVISATLGHMPMGTTEREYTHLSMDYWRAEIEKLRVR